MTTIRGFLASFGLALVSWVGCASDPVEPSEPSDLIDYHLQSWGENAKLHINTDGTFTVTEWDGSVEAGQLRASELEALQSAVEEAQFPTLDPTYGCGGCADDAVHTITVHIDDAAYTVRADDHFDYPFRLQPLITRLHGLVTEPLP